MQKTTNGAADAPRANNRKSGGRRGVPGIVLPFLVRELLSGLRPAQLVVWICIYLHSNREGCCCLKNHTLVAETGIGKNAFQEAKRELIEKGWLENCGQRERRGANIYRVKIPTPEAVARITDSLWDRLNEEAWYEKLGFDEGNYAYTDNQIDWLVNWRVIRAVKEIDPNWTARTAIEPAIAERAEGALLERLRRAGKLLCGDDGLWILWGDAYDKAGLPKTGNPKDGDPGYPKTGNPGFPKNGQAA